MTIQEAFVDSVDQDQTAENVWSDLWSTLSTFCILDYKYTTSSSFNVYFQPMKNHNSFIQ